MKKILLGLLALIGLRKPLVEAFYRRKSRQFYGRIISSGDLVFDVGANIGNRSACFLSLGAKVVAFEPQSSCVNRLRERFRGNEAFTLENVGLSDKETTMELVISSESSVIASMSDRWVHEGRFSKTTNWDHKETVAVLTLDQMIARHGRPKFCKIDVEGFELSVLKGLSTPIPFISIEFTREFLDDSEQCVRHLQALYPSLQVNFSVGERMEYANREYTSSEAVFKQLRSYDSPDLWGDIYIRSVPA